MLATTPPLVYIQNVTKGFQEADRERIVLNDVSIEFFEGEFAVLLGPSGSGKSTLLNVISGVDVTDSGNIKIQETCITQMSEHDRTLFRRDNIGIVFQSFNLIPTLTVLENVTLPYELQGKSRKSAQEKARHILDRVGLVDREDTYPDRLSGGQQQRVAIARAVVHEPLLILADEPTGNLDRKTSDEVLALLLSMSRDLGKTLIMATHSMEIIPLADRIFRISPDGKLIEDTERLKQGAEIRAEIEAQMAEQVAEQLAQLDPQLGGSAAF
jgi:putative ABC transport system ATP-binding protein